MDKDKPKNPYDRYEDEAKGFKLGPPPEPPKEEAKEGEEAPKPGEGPKPTPGKP